MVILKSYLFLSVIWIVVVIIVTGVGNCMSIENINLYWENQEILSYYNIMELRYFYAKQKYSLIKQLLLSYLQIWKWPYLHTSCTFSYKTFTIIKYSVTTISKSIEFDFFERKSRYYCKSTTGYWSNNIKILINNKQDHSFYCTLYIYNLLFYSTVTYMLATSDLHTMKMQAP